MRMMCAQRGCVFDRDVAPDNCPVCENPYIPNDENLTDDLPLSDHPAAANPGGAAPVVDPVVDPAPEPDPLDPGDPPPIG